jgi:hypothetical protein
MASPTIDPDSLVGKCVAAVVVGWHVHGSDRAPVQLFLRLSDGTELQVHPSGDGSLVLMPGAAPANFDMDQYGYFEFQAAAIDHPANMLVDRTISEVEQIHWGNTVVGLRLRVANETVVLANEADSVFVSDGRLPPAYVTATIE